MGIALLLSAVFEMDNNRVITVSKFLRQYDSENTRRNYKAGLKTFFEVMYPDSNEGLDVLSERYLTEDRDHREDILNFKDSLKGRAPKTIESKLNVIRVFLDENSIEFPKRFFKNLNGKVTEAISEEKIPTNQELRKIIEYLPVQGKALALILSSSGMRIGEIIQIKLNDVELNRDPARIKIRAEYTKTGKKRITFISPEAKEAVEEWLSYRSQYLERAHNRTQEEFRKNKTDNLFPFTTANFNLMWRNALGKAKLLEIDERTNRTTMRPHNLRKFFRLRVGRYGRDEAEALMGHQAGLNRIYANFDGAEERLEEVYKKSIEELSIYKRTVQIVQIDEEMKNTIRELEDQVNVLIKSAHVKEARNEAKMTYLSVNDEKKTREIAQLTINNDRLKNKVADMERDLQSWKMTVQDFDKIIQHLLSKNHKLTAEEEE